MKKIVITRDKQPKVFKFFDKIDKEENELRDKAKELLHTLEELTKARKVIHEKLWDYIGDVTGIDMEKDYSREYINEDIIVIKEKEEDKVGGLIEKMMKNIFNCEDCDDNE